jgi:DNA polymerase elongation subunit (family B)
VGIHERIAEVDFTSLYPSIMVRHNISPETVDCRCCPSTTKLVPELGYRICQRQLGLVPRVLKPVIERRIELKRLVRANAPHKDIYDQRQKVLKWLLVTCFGYTGYKNARFGRIECHESINAYGRDILLRTTEMAEERGFRILHGIVDSLWLEGKGDAQSLCDDVSKDIGIPLILDGIYKWIVFLPATTTGVGALNRYYGLFENGELKLRGIFLRKSDTIELARDLQNDMLAVFSKASGVEAFKARIPEALDVLDSYLDRLRDRSVPMEKLIMIKHVSKPFEEYTQFTHSYAALKQMEEMGFPVPPGKSVEYVVCDGDSRNPWERVKVASFLNGSEEYDVDEYSKLLRRATADLLHPFGWSFEALEQRDAIATAKL